MAVREISPDKNEAIRNAMAAAGVKHWELANAMGISRTTLQDRLRYVMTDEVKRSYFTVIEGLKAAQH